MKNAMKTLVECAQQHRDQPDAILTTLKSTFAEIDRLNPTLNAIVHEFRDQSFDRAKTLISQADNAHRLPLYGVPITIKESFAYQNSLSTINFPPLKTFRPSEDSILATRLEEAGAIIIGKTNVPMMLSDCQTFGPLYPTANNPFKLTHTPGGSTGGGAAALAAGLSYAEIGSDIGGSIRNPASFCGLYGLKPTTNGHARDGHTPPLPGTNKGFTALNSTGPLARSAADLEAVYSVCYQPLPALQQYLNVDNGVALKDTIKDYKFAYFDCLKGLTPSEPTQLGLQRTINAIKATGASVELIKLDDCFVEQCLKTWVQIFGFVAGQDFSRPMRALLKFQFGRDLKRSSINAKHALKNGLSLDFKKYSQALAQQTQCIEQFNTYFTQYDFILSPTSLGPAFPHNHKHKDITVNGTSYNYADYCFAFVMLYNLLGNPVLELPSGIDEQTELPIGISIAALHHGEKHLLDLAKKLERLGFGFTPPKIK